MSVKRVFSDLIQKVDIKMFHDVWFDFRAGIYAKYKFSEPFIIDEYLTYYRVSPTNVSYKFKHLSDLWWKRRLDYHNYEKLYCEKINTNILLILIIILLKYSITFINETKA